MAVQCGQRNAKVVVESDVTDRNMDVHGGSSSFSDADVAEVASLFSALSALDSASMSFVERDQLIEIPNYTYLKSKKKRWESPPLRTIQGYRYTLVFRPNGLKFTEGYNECIGVWLKPMPSEADDGLEWPARVKMALRVKSFTSDSDSEGDENLVIPMKEYTWKKEDTNSRYPVFAFPSTIKHTAVEKEEAKCVVDDGTLYIVVEEEEIQ